jgi:hypothetical protein
LPQVGERTLVQAFCHRSIDHERRFGEGTIGADMSSNSKE